MKAFWGPVVAVAWAAALLVAFAGCSTTSPHTSNSTALAQTGCCSTATGCRSIRPSSATSSELLVDALADPGLLAGIDNRTARRAASCAESLRAWTPAPAHGRRACLRAQPRHLSLVAAAAQRAGSPATAGTRP